MSVLRIFSYLPNPRIAKATIAARLCGVSLEVRGAPVQELQDWLWDFDAHPLSVEERDALRHCVRTGRTGFTSALYKTDAFLAAHPFGAVPAAFDPSGQIGIFESNSILRAVARLGDGRVPLYGSDAYSASRIDGFLDASLLFARDTQLYVLALRAETVTAGLHAAAQQAFTSYLSGIERALASGAGFIAGGTLSLADICFAAELALFHNERVHHGQLHRAGLAPVLSDGVAAEHPLAWAHFGRLCAHEAFAPDIEPYLEAFGKH